MLLVALFSLFFQSFLGAITTEDGVMSTALMHKGTMRLMRWGALAMVLTSIIGSLFEVMA